MAASRCLCCGRAMRPSGARVWAIVLFITCWYVLNPVYNSNNLVFSLILDLFWDLINLYFASKFYLWSIKFPIFSSSLVALVFQGVLFNCWDLLASWVSAKCIPHQIQEVHGRKKPIMWDFEEGSLWCGSRLRRLNRHHLWTVLC